MNNARMWLVVNPSVGVPLFLTGVAVGSFAVHVAVLSNTSWVGDYLSGKPLGSTASAALTPNLDDATSAVALKSSVGDVTMSRSSLEALKNSASPSVLITLPDGTTARAIIEMPTEVAAVAPK